MDDLEVGFFFFLSMFSQCKGKNQSHSAVNSRGWIKGLRKLARSPRRVSVLVWSESSEDNYAFTPFP